MSKEKKKVWTAGLCLQKKKITIQINHVTLILLQLSLSRLPERFPLDTLNSDIILHNHSWVDLLFWGEITDGSQLLSRLCPPYSSRDSQAGTHTYPPPAISSPVGRLLFNPQTMCIFMPEEIIQQANLFRNLKGLSATIKSLVTLQFSITVITIETLRPF